MEQIFSCWKDCRRSKTSIQQMVMSSKRKNWICSHEKDDVVCAPLSSSQGNDCTYLVELFWILSSKTAKLCCENFKSSDYSICICKESEYIEKKRNRLTSTRTTDLVFVFGSLRLKERIFYPNSKEEFVEWASDKDEPPQSWSLLHCQIQTLGENRLMIAPWQLHHTNLLPYTL